MSSVGIRVVDRPTLLFDGACGFCRRAVLRFQAVAGDRVACVPYQDFEFPAGDPRLDAAGCEQAVHLVEPDGTVTRAAAACFRALSLAPGKRLVRAVYGLPGCAPLWEWCYRQVAGRRVGISRLQRLLSGDDPMPPTYGLGRRLLLTLLGLAFAVAFTSFGVQAAGLLGSGGVLPLGRMIAWDQHVMPQALLDMPTVFWFAHGDTALVSVLAAGGLAGLLLALGLWPRAMLCVATLSWLSVSALAFPPDGAGYIGNVFLGYQWDGLLCEAGVLALFVAPRGVRPRWTEPPGGAGLLLLRLLLLRVVLGSALVRLTSGDPTWGEPGALGLHLWTQPLPTFVGAVVHEWSDGLQRALAIAGDVVGVGLVFGLFGPRRLRLCAVVAILLAEASSFATARLGVFQLCVAALALCAVDDPTWRRVLPNALGRRIPQPVWRAVPALVQGVRCVLAVALAALAVDVGVRYLAQAEPSALQRALVPFQVCNAYGPFPSVVVKRYAVTIEGTVDGTAWLPYDTRMAPRDPFRAPPGPGLHLPRLDWKLDDVAHRLADGGSVPAWFELLLVRLLEGAPDVRALFAAGAWEEAPPRALRVMVHELVPAEAAVRRKDGMWWYRRPGALAGTPVGLVDGKLLPVRF